MMGRYGVRALGDLVDMLDYSTLCFWGPVIEEQGLVHRAFWI